MKESQHLPPHSYFYDIYVFILSFFNFLKIFYLFILDSGEGREKERERNINVRLHLLCLLLGTWPGPQPRHVPWLGIQPVTLWLSGCHSIHWATPARSYPFFIIMNSIKFPDIENWDKTYLVTLYYFNIYPHTYRIQNLTQKEMESMNLTSWKGILQHLLKVLH